MISSTPPERHIIPRWRHSNLTIMSGETNSLAPHPTKDWLDDLSELKASITVWEKGPLLSQALELITTALLYNRPEAGINAIRYVLDNTEERCLANKLAYRLFSLLEDYTLDNTYELDLEDEPTKAKRTIKRLRNDLRSNPRNPLGWMDLAHAQASLGQPDKAEKSMRIALASGTPNRIILRSASRLYVHQNEPDRGHQLLYKSETVKHDPWLLAAEVATASMAKHVSRLTRHAKRMIKDDSINHFHKTELAGALATLELEAGQYKAAKKLFRMSLIRPTENSVAQAKWAATLHLGEIEALHSHLDIERGYEARAYHANSQGDWEASVAEAWNWLKDEPYSPLPAIYGSYIASVGSLDFSEAKRIAQAGLKANPNDPFIRNNLVFALVNMEQLDEAEREFKRIKVQQNDPSIQLILLATEGLINYRKGNTDQGRFLYQKSMDKARQNNNTQALTLASIFLANEEILSQSPSAQKAISNAISIARRHKLTPELAQWHNDLENVVIQNC